MKQDRPLITARIMSGGSGSSAPVEHLARFIVSDTLRAMLESAQSPPLLQPLYLDLRERVDQVSSSPRILESLSASIQPVSLQATQAQEQSLDIKHEVDGLREVLQELSKDTSREASGHDADILALPSCLDELKTRSSNTSHLKSRIEKPTLKLSDTQANIATVLGEIQALRELTKNLTTETRSREAGPVILNLWHKCLSPRKMRVRVSLTKQTRHPQDSRLSKNPHDKEKVSSPLPLKSS